jgi:glycosyltransferase involved in cell wall biosynthesis
MILSVVIVARNEERNIVRCIESVLANTQVIPETEILLADSASTDRTVEIASRYPINIISLKPEWPLSPSAGRFSGVNNVSGEYVLIIDGDMELLEGWIEKALEFMRANPNVASVMGKHFDMWGTSEGLMGDVRRNSWLGDKACKVKFVFGSSLFRRDLLLAVGNFHPFLHAEEEAEVSYRLTQKGYELYFLPYDSICHYSIPRKSFQETMRRIRNNLYRGMGDMFLWSFQHRRYIFLWERFKIYLCYMFLSFLYLVGLLFYLFSEVSVGVVFILFPICLWLVAIIKKKSILKGSLSVVNITIISYYLTIGLFRKVRGIDEYPHDVMRIKREYLGLSMKNNHLLFIGFDFQNIKKSGDKNFWVDLIPLLAPAFSRITILSIKKASLTCEEFNVGNCKIIVKFISPVFLKTPIADSRGIFWKEGIYPSYLGIIEKLLVFRKLKREIINFKRHSPFTHIHLMDNFGFNNRLISQCADTAVTVSAIAYQGKSPAFIYDNYLRVSYDAPNLKVIAYSEILRKKLMVIGVAPENIVTIPWGVSPGEQLKEELIDKRSLKETFSIQIDQPLILWSGYMQQIKRKDFLFAYNLAKEVKNKGYKGTFFFAFKPESFENKFYKIADEAKQLGIIIKVTSKEEFDNLANLADVFFSPLVNNRCIVAPPLTWIEMLNKGIPIVTTAVPGTENIVVNGETGFLFSSLEGLVNSLINIVEKPISYSLRCKDFVKRRFNIKQCTEAYIELFTSERATHEF